MLNGCKNDSLVFDAAGKCILNLYGPDDMVPLQGLTEPSAVGTAGSSKGRKYTKSAPKTAVNPKKRRRVVISEEEKDGDEDERLVDLRPSKRKAPNVLDQSLEGKSFIVYSSLKLNILIEIDTQLDATIDSDRE